MASSSVYRNAAEEAFLEQTPWANPLHPIHQHQQRPQGQVYENPRAPPYTTPAAQKRVVDVNAPNGSASTIAENSSANNTPYDQEHQPQGLGQFTHPDYEADRRSGFRSLTSSPLDMRKPQPAPYHGHDHRSPQQPAVSRNAPGASSAAAYSPPPARLGLFQRRESSPPSMSAKPVNSIHQSSGLLGGPGSSNQMAAR